MTYMKKKVINKIVSFSIFLLIGLVCLLARGMQ